MRVHRLFLLSRSAVVAASLFFLAVPIAEAALYLPGETLDPACAPTDSNCGITTTVASSTANSIPYYAANGSALAATSTFQILANGTASTSDLIIRNSLTVGSLSGFLKATAGAIATALINLASDVTGILPVGNGGTGVSALASGFIPFGNGTGAFATSSSLYFDSTNGRFGLGTTSPWALLSVNPNGITGPAFVVGSSTATNFMVSNGGYVGIGTTSPFTLLSVAGNGYLQGSLNVGDSATTRSNLGLTYAAASDYNYYNITMWGDSLTEGLGPVIQRLMPDYNVFNGGVHSESSGQIETRFMADPAKWNDTTTIWAGWNDRSYPSYVQENITDMVSSLPATTNYAVLTVIFGSNDTLGSVNHTNIVSINDYIATTYPNNYLDVNATLMSTCNALGPSNTTGWYASTTQDQIDCGNVVTPTSLRADAVHLNTTGYEIVARQVKNFIAAFDSSRSSTVPTTLNLRNILSALPPVENFSIMSTTTRDYAPVLDTEYVVTGAWASGGSALPAHNWTTADNESFAHTAGDTTSLTNTLIANTGAQYYRLRFTISNWSAGSVSLTLGGVTPSIYAASYSANGTYDVGFRTTGGTTLSFSPHSTADFAGTISGISVEQITQPSYPVFSLLDGTGLSTFEIHSSPTSLYNTFLGGGSAITNGASPGSYNISGYGNTGIGVNALGHNISGYYNTAVGYNALSLNVHGYSNIAIGHSTLGTNTLGFSNVAIGRVALNGNTTGNGNIALGTQALYTNTAGGNNIAFGTAAEYKVTTGGQNIAIGGNSLYNVTTASYNIGIGYQAGYNTTGANNTLIGSYIDAPTLSGSRQLNIGNVLYGSSLYNGTSQSSAPVADGKIGIGTTSPYAILSISNNATTAINTTLFAIASTTGGVSTTTVFSVASTGDVTINGSSGSSCVIGNGTGGTSCTSDERLKTNVTLIPGALSGIEQIDGITFNWADQTKSKNQFIGVVAQQVQKVFPQAVSTSADGTLSVDYGSLVAPLIEAIKEIGTISNEFRSRLVAWLGDAANGIGDFFASTIHTQNLCIGSTCITESELRAMLDKGVGSEGVSGSIVPSTDTTTESLTPPTAISAGEGSDTGTAADNATTSEGLSELSPTTSSDTGSEAATSSSQSTEPTSETPATVVSTPAEPSIDAASSEPPPEPPPDTPEASVSTVTNE